MANLFERAKARGADVGAAIRDYTILGGMAAAGFAAGLAGSIVRITPKTGGLFKKLALGALEQYHKKAGGDAIGLVALPGQQLDVVPVIYRPPTDAEDDEAAGWVAKGMNKSWNAGSEGRVVDHLGDVPIVALDHDDHAETGWLAPRISEAIELDNYDPIFTEPDFNVTVDAGPGAAIADGGYEIELEEPGRWMGDAVIDLDSGPNHDGMRISFRKATEWRAETTTTEEMARQEERGYYQGLAQGDSGPSAVKILLLSAAIILGTLAMVFVVPEMMGSSLGEMNPL